MLGREATRWISLLSLFTFMTTCVSCSQSSGRYPARGEVTFKGDAVDKGSIVFVPLVQNAIKTGGPIVEGRYEVPAAKGSVAGKHRVLLFWEKKTGKTYVDSDTGEVFDRRTEGLPATYQSENSPLEVEIANGDNVHDFHLK